MTHALTPELESELRREIDRLRAEVAAQAGLVRMLQAAVELTYAASREPAGNEAKALQQTLRDCGFIVASDSQPSEQTR